MPLRIENPNETPLQVGKWLQVQALLDSDEMRLLVKGLDDFFIFATSALCQKGEEVIGIDEFLQTYDEYILSLKKGEVPQDRLYRRCFNSVWTRSPDHLYATPVGEEKQFVQVAKPVIQLQAHRLDYSPVDGKFRAMVLGLDSISWGLQFSYPQLCEDPNTKEIEKITESDKFPNTQLFRRLQRWIRHHTLATPFVIDGKRTNVPMRLGKKCLEWINTHPQLIKKNIQVFVHD